MDAATSFTHLVDSVPQWKTQITELLTYTSQKHEEFKAEYTRLVAKAKPRRLKSPSICSIHANDDNQSRKLDISRESTPQPPDPVDISPFEAGNRYIYAQATKKRKPGTSFRSGASGPMKYRSKQMVVIYYDSHVQEKLDSLVKSIGGSRNNLRKGKMSYTVSKGLQLPSLSRKYEMSSSLSGYDGVRSAAAYRHSPKIPSVKSDTTSTISENTSGTEEGFKQTDKELEACQNLCETAAHQFLRDGDCKLELDTVADNLDKILELAKGILGTIRSEEKKDEMSPEDISINGSTHTESDATLVEKSSREVLHVNHKTLPSPDVSFGNDRPHLPTAHSAPPMMTEIEVDDDSDQSSIELDISKYRMTNRAANRGGIRT